MMKTKASHAASLWIPAAVCAVLLLVSVWFLHRQARQVSEMFLDVPYTTRLYYDAGLKGFALGTPISNIQMSLSSNDVACTYFNDAAKNTTCLPPDVDRIATPAPKSAQGCATVQSTSMPKNASDSGIMIWGQLYRWTKTCRVLAFNTAGTFDNSTPAALRFMLARPVFVRLPRCALYKVDYGPLFFYQWPSQACTLPMKQVTDKTLDAAVNTLTIDAVMSRRSSPDAAVALQTTSYHISSTPAAAQGACGSGLFTKRGQVTLPLAATNGGPTRVSDIGDNRLRLLVDVANKKLTVQIGPSDKPDMASPPLKNTFVLSAVPTKSIGYCWSVADTGFVVFLSLDGGKEVLMAVGQGQVGLLKGAVRDAKTSCRLPNLLGFVSKLPR